MTHPFASRMKLAGMMIEASVLDNDIDYAIKTVKDESSKLDIYIGRWEKKLRDNPDIEATFKRCLEYQTFGSFINGIKNVKHDDLDSEGLLKPD